MQDEDDGTVVHFRETVQIHDEREALALVVRIRHQVPNTTIPRQILLDALRDHVSRAVPLIGRLSPSRTLGMDTCG